MSLCGANRYVRNDGLRCLAVQQSLCQVRGGGGRGVPVWGQPLRTCAAWPCSSHSAR